MRLEVWMPWWSTEVTKRGIVIQEVSQYLAFFDPFQNATPCFMQTAS